MSHADRIYVICPTVRPNIFGTNLHCIQNILEPGFNGLMYSLDFRRLAVKLYRSFSSYGHVARLLSVSKSTIHRWVMNGITPKKRFRHHRRWVDRVQEIVTDELVSGGSVCTVGSLVGTLATRGHCVSRSTVCNIVKTLGFSYKRARGRVVTYPATQSDKESQFAAAFCNHQRSGHTVVSIDECYFSERITPLYGYSKRGQPCVVSKPASWKQRTLLLAISNAGAVEHVVYNGTCNRSRFEEFVRGLPFAPGTVLTLDNVAFHHRCQSICDKGYIALFTPPYRPVYNAVEMAFSKVKNAFRKMPARADVCRMVKESVEAIRPSDVLGYFKHVTDYVNAVITEK